jgi:hypothetical protein
VNTLGWYARRAQQVLAGGGDAQQVALAILNLFENGVAAPHGAPLVRQSFALIVLTSRLWPAPTVSLRPGGGTPGACRSKTYHQMTGE